MKVLMLLYDLRVAAGVSSYAMNYYRTLDHSKIRMDFVTYRSSESQYIEEIRNNGDEVFVLPPFRNIFKHSQACLSIIRNGQYDIIHDNSLLITLPFMSIAKKHVGIRILHSHSARLGETVKNEKRNRVFLPLLLSNANHYTACSNKAGKALFNERNFTVIPNVINTERFRYSQEIRKRIRTQEKCEGKRIIASIGRLSDAKNPIFAIDVIEKVVHSNSDIMYWWIGSGALYEQVCDYVRKKGLEKKIRLFENRSDIPDLLQAIDLFFMPSKSEGFGLACLEASAAGLPCVVSDEFPSEIDVAGNVRFVSLRQTKQEWAEILLDQLVSTPNRLDANEKIRHSIYSDTDAGKHLYEYYCSLLNQ